MYKAAFLVTVVVFGACSTEGYRGAWAVVGEGGGELLISRDSALHVRGYSITYSEWRELDDGSLFFQTDDGDRFVAEVLLQTSDRLTFVVDGDTIRLVRQEVPKRSPAARFIGGDFGPRRMVEYVDSLEAAEASAVVGEAQPESEATSLSASADLAMPDWLEINATNRTVTIEIIAGKDDSNNRWNFNGYSRGNGAIVVPLGYTVTINFRNDDPNIAHSIGVDTRTGDFPATFQDPEPVFAGAISAAATSMQEATQPGESESFSFTADAAGEYSLICYIPAHAATGMWIRFTVSSDGEVGFAGVG